MPLLYIEIYRKKHGYVLLHYNVNIEVTQHITYNIQVVVEKRII